MSSLSSRASRIHYSPDARLEAVVSLIANLDHCCQLLLDAHACTKPNANLSHHRKSYVQLLIFHYLYFHVSQLGNLMCKVGSNLTEKQDESLDPQRINFTRSVLSEMTSDSLLWEDLRDISRLNIELVNSVIDILSQTVVDGSVDQQTFGMLRAEIRLECSAQNKLASQVAERYDRMLRDFELFRGIQDSSGVWLLTLLASIFIPLSLATGILSMQTRFVDLHFLLYDFVGVVIIIGSSAVLLFVMLKLILWLTDLATKSEIRLKYVRENLPLASWILTILGVSWALQFWALVFTSFMVGMIRDIGLGLKILGFGSAAFLGVSVVLFLLPILGEWIPARLG